MRKALALYILERTNIFFYDSKDTKVFDLNTEEGYKEYKRIREELLNEHNNREEDNKKSG